MNPAEIADALAVGLHKGHRLEKTLYYEVARACLASAKTADARTKTILFVAGHLAMAMAEELEADAIVAQADGLWSGYAQALESVIRLADESKSPQETLWGLSAAIAAIYPPRGAPWRE